MAVVRVALAAVLAVALIGCGASDRRAASRAGVAAASEPSFCARLHGAAALDDGDGSSGAFPTANLGWILFTPDALHEAGGVGVCDSLLRVTTDGGRHFRAVRIPAGSFAGVVAGSTRDVWLIGKRSYASVDGGHRWVPVGLPAGVEQVVLNGRVTMATAQTSQQGAVQFLRSVDGGIVWRRQLLPRHTFGDLVARGPVVVMETTTRVLVSDDGGRAFVSRRSACSMFDHPFVAIDPANTIWELCAGDPSAGSQEKLVFRSSDLGRQWIETRRWTPHSPPSPFDNGYASALAAPALATLVLTQARGGLLFSDDGGRHWIDALPDINDADPAPGWLSFPSSSRGYAWIYENHVFSTRDSGRRWRTVPIRPLG